MTQATQKTPTPVPAWAYAALAGGLLMACVLVTLLFPAIAAKMEWTNSFSTALPMALQGTGAVFLAGLVGFSLYAINSPKGVGSFAFCVLGSSGIRMLLGLAIALGLSLVMNPEKRTFWGSFLVSALIVLIVETAVGMVVGRMADAPSPAVPTTALNPQS